MRPRKAPARTAITSRLAEAIGADGRSAYAIGKAAGVNAAMISRFLSGERGLSLDTADRLAEVLGLRLVEVARPGARRRASAAADPS